MNRIAGIETEYGCLVTEDDAEPHADSWPGRVKNHIFHETRLGAIDLHYRDYEEPPGNGGFLRNGGRLYMDMGHLEYASPECRSLLDMVNYDVAGDMMLQEALDDLGASDHVAFIKNNIDHHTGATFGCHENYLMRRDAEFTPEAVGTLLSFLATRQIFTGAGRVGQANPLAFEMELAPELGAVDFQMSQRADHIVNDIYQWVQFNRAIINARDEPLADHRKFRRLHLLLGDSNMSPFATALKIGTTSCILTLIEERRLPEGVILADAVTAMRAVSRAADVCAEVELANGGMRRAIDIQREILDHAAAALSGRDAETDWILENWGFTLDALAHAPERLLGGVDWVSKRWMLDAFRESEMLEWDDPWLQSLDLEYHNINPARGLFFELAPAKAIRDFNAAARRVEAITSPPADTRARGRGLAVEHFIESKQPHVINWDSIALAGDRFVRMPDPFRDYCREVRALIE